MAMRIKLPSGEEAEVTETVTLQLGGGAHVIAENKSVAVLAQKDWSAVMQVADRLADSVAMVFRKHREGWPPCITITLPDGNTLRLCVPTGTGPTFPTPPDPEGPIARK